MLVAGFPAGPWATNCFVVATAAGAECVVIDPGKDSGAPIDDLVREHRLQPVAVILTHGHIDHMFSVQPVCASHRVPAYIHPADRSRLADPMGFAGRGAADRRDAADAMAAMLGGHHQFVEPDEVRELADGEVLQLAGLQLKVSHAPGHTEGSVVYGTQQAGDVPPLLFSGDVLFEGSIGRTDLPGGDHQAMLASLARVILPLPDQTVVLPGHGATTSIGRERTANPYLQHVAADVPPVRRGL
ncbi:MAG: MBL fold metallo-hydrolase [Actinomycetota bacterium]|nr:MAG: MBL fold metallo-hydrolase [Actinomycetota bacterium]